MSNRGRILIGVGVLAAAIVAFVLWRRGGDTGETRTVAGAGSAGSGVRVEQRGAKDPATGLPRWLGQMGVAGRRIAGIVVGEDGAPIRGATVRLGSTFAAAKLAQVPARTTDDAGRFDFGAQAAATYVLTAESPKLTAALESVDLRNPRVKSDQLLLMLHPCDASIHGSVVDTAGGPVGGATVARFDGLLLPSAGVVADDNGIYELCVPAGGARVTVGADGYAATMDNVDVYGRTRRDYQLTPGTSVVGRVVRAADKAPVEGAIVELRAEDPRASVLPLFTSSGADGAFAFDGVAPGRHQISARGDRVATADPVEAIAEVGTTGPEVVVELVTAYSIAGTVVQTGDKKPVGGARVTLSSQRRARWEAGAGSAITQTDGTFVIEHALPGKYRLMVDNDDDAATPVEVVATDVTGVELTIGNTSSIAGRVLANGKPVDSAFVRSGQFATTTDADGTFVLRRISDGTHQLYAESHIAGAFTQGPKVTVAPGEDKTGVDIVLDLSASVSGTVVDQNDAPVAGASLRFSLLRGRDFGSATTADDGSFTARSMSGGGDYIYEVRQRDGSAIVYPPVSGKRHPPIAVKDGGTHITGVRVKVRVERLAIGGRITDGAGKPVADAVVQAVPRDGRWYKLPTATTDQTGAFMIRELQAGTYAVRAKTARGEASEDNVAAGRTDLALRLLDPGGIDVSVEGFTGKPGVHAFRVEERFTRHTATLAGAVYQLRNLPAGRYQVTATDGTDRVTQGVVVTPGNVETVTLKRGEVGSVEGTVVDEKTRAPVPGMTCMVQQAGGDDFGYGGRPESTAGATGTFRIERVAAGPSIVGCWSQTGASAWKQVTVVAGEIARVELLATKGRGDDDGGRSGLELESQLGDVVVESVKPNSPGARAGIVVGDVIYSVNGQVIGRDQEWQAMRGLENGGDTVKVVLERNDKQITVQLSFAAAPPTTP